jgi:subtilisin family serine protease
VGVLDLVRLTQLMDLTAGRPEVVIGLIDGPVIIDHPDLVSSSIRATRNELRVACDQAGSAACVHGTFVAGVLSANRKSGAPAICPNCTLLVRPIFEETDSYNQQIPSSTPDELADAIIECINAGARILNLSVALASLSSKGESQLEEALDFAARNEVIVVAAAGNQGEIGSNSITRHPWVIPVVACDLRGKLMGLSNLGPSIGKRGLSAPGEQIISLGAIEATSFSGTSAAAPFVTGAIALLWSEFPRKASADVKRAIGATIGYRRTSIVPPLLDAWTAYEMMKAH